MGSTIRTFSGLHVNPLELTIDDICVEDIAHHLSLLCRYIGACPDFYSIAQHSVIVALRMHHAFGYREAGRAGLFHDASEAYLHDIPSPVKHSPLMVGYREIEERTTNVIFHKFNMPDSSYWHERIKPFDIAVYNDEVATFWDKKEIIHPLPPKEAEQMFLAAYRNFNEYTTY